MDPRRTSSHGGGAGRQRLGLILGPLLFLLVLILPAPSGMAPDAWPTAAVAVLMATWWITEAIPIPATALLPLALFPLLGVLDIGATAAPYANPVIFLFLGGFLIAQAMQRWELHRRMALAIIGRVGTYPLAITAGFMLAAALLSMWVSNTATTIMMLPIGVSVIALVLRDSGDAGANPARAERTGPAPTGADPVSGPPASPGGAAAAGPGAPAAESIEPTADMDPGEGRNFALVLMLGIAYGASIGGLATLIGTPPNALFAGFMAESYGVEIGFAQWMLVGVPVTVVALPLAWWVLARWVYPVRLPALPEGQRRIREETAALGPLSRGEWTVGIVFGLTALAWVTRPILEGWIPGLSDAGIAIAAAVALFLLPVDLRRGEFALNWEWARRLPWDVLILFGGGLSLAAAITASGLADWLGASMSGLAAVPVLVMILAVVAVIVFLTELTSNTASAAAFLPVLAALAIAIGEDPLLLALPAALAASCAFMLPVATPPNAIVFGSGHITIPQMARAGVVLNLLFIVLITAMAYVLAGLVFGVEHGAVPGWADSPDP